MGTKRTRTRRKEPSEKQRPFFDKQGTDHVIFFNKSPLRRRLKIGKADDAAEKDAESTAQKIVQVQKEEKKEEEKPVQKEEKKEEEKPIQKAGDKEEEEQVQKAESKKDVSKVQEAPVMKAGEEKTDSKSSLENILARRKGMGFILPDDLRNEMERKLHASFKEVRIHTDREAADLCDAIHARAFSHGYDIYFNDGMYCPESLSGKELLAHELVHVVQQNG